MGPLVWEHIDANRRRDFRSVADHPVHLYRHFFASCFVQRPPRRGLVLTPVVLMAHKRSEQDTTDLHRQPSRESHQETQWRIRTGQHHKHATVRVNPGPPRTSTRTRSCFLFLFHLFQDIFTLLVSRSQQCPFHAEPIQTFRAYSDSYPS